MAGNLYLEENIEISPYFGEQNTMPKEYFHIIILLWINL